MSPLRRYQLPAFAAILAAWERQDADAVVVRMPRQAGKNEVSARAEAVLLSYNARQGGSGVKAAPTQTPQAIRSRDRLARHLRSSSSSRAWRNLITAGGDSVSLGAATWWFGSGEAGANVVGGTASILLEFDEAQDFDMEKHDKDYSPMAAAFAAPRIYYGTPWTEFDLLETSRRAALEREARDGRQRVFDVRWEEVAAEVPSYGLFVEMERERLGHSEATPHPAFVTQYLLRTLPGQGRLFNPAQLGLLQGDHRRLADPQSSSHNVYVAGIDVGGSDLSRSGDPDETVLVLARARFPGRGQNIEPIIDIVNVVTWAGATHDQLLAELLPELVRWRVGHVVVDATGLGEPLATSLSARLGAQRVTALKVSRPSKSALGYDLLAAANTGCLRLWQPDGAEHAALVAQLRLARVQMLPGSFMNFYVDPSEGHDDRLIAVALAVRAAQRGRPRVARSRSA